MSRLQLSEICSVSLTVSAGAQRGCVSPMLRSASVETFLKHRHDFTTDGHVVLGLLKMQALQHWGVTPPPQICWQQTPPVDMGSLCHFSQHSLSPVLFHNRSGLSTGDGPPSLSDGLMCSCMLFLLWRCCAISGEGASTGPASDFGGPRVSSEVTVCQNNQSASGKVLNTSPLY